MPFIDKEMVFYQSITGCDKIKADILKKHIKRLEGSYYPHEKVYPTKRLPLAQFSSKSSR